VRKTAKPSVAVVGAGNLARAIAPALKGAGYRVTEVISRDGARSRAKARALAKSAGARPVTFDQAKLDAGVVWVCVSDAAIAQVGRELARGRDWRGKVALHSSGALASDELRPLRARGASIGSAHPMMTFTGAKPPQLHGLTFAIEGDAKAARVARQITLDLGGEPFAIRKRQKTLYHALGSFSSPLLIMLLAQAEQVGRGAGLNPTQTKKVMRAILRRTLDNYLAGGAAAAFSGPIKRGDLVTIKRHMKELQKVTGALEVYRALAKASLKTLPVGRRREMEQILGVR
jgi:predicted short-subunit dehydrogenase-like oxidoreductase (DUF2520 family)